MVHHHKLLRLTDEEFTNLLHTYPYPPIHGAPQYYTIDNRGLLSVFPFMSKNIKIVEVTIAWEDDNGKI